MAGLLVGPVAGVPLAGGLVGSSCSLAPAVCCAGLFVCSRPVRCAAR
ncbi:MAG: hypothetical protein IPJ48_11040 [Propionivibrio sp.]|uniref:Uncharacterized protein n=1 Tax=Candidatus Propionivibrio dominans TaxID=2954373 RepID=A0A9D7FCY0_9RHOO|nr:hypothetical protein [Candidatus Propionivibrio dominans]MBL0166887.1 hypothetical protein [Propionivibrio sp.]